MTRKSVVWIVVGGVVVGAVAIRVAVLRSRGIDVDVARIGRGSVEQTVTNSRAGTVKAERRAKLSPEIGGRVAAIPKRKGDTVRAGEIVLQIDSTVEEAQRASAGRAAAAAEASERQSCLAADRAGRERDRVKRLEEQQIVSADDLDASESAFRAAAEACTAARAERDRARSELEVAERFLAKRVLRAPFDGIVADTNIEVGEWATPALPGLPIPPLVDVLDPASINFEFPMDEVDAGKLRPGLPARVTVDSAPGESFGGRIFRVAPFVLDVEKQNRTVAIDVQLDDRAAALRFLPGTSADVEVVLATREGVLRIPSAAVLTNDRVLAVVEGTLVERPLTLGLRNWDWTEVRSGLAEGDRVVVSLDRPEVKAGERVEKMVERSAERASKIPAATPPGR